MENKGKKALSMAMVLETLLLMASCRGSREYVNPDDSYFANIINGNNSNTNDEPINASDFYTTRMSLIDTKYNSIDYYPTMNDIASYKKIYCAASDCPETSTNYDGLASKIINNSINNYGEESGLTNPAINEVVSTSLNNALRIIFNNASNDVAEDICKIGSIMLVIKDLSYYGSVDGSFTQAAWEDYDNVLAIDYDLVGKLLESKNLAREMNGLEPLSMTDYLTYVLQHELNHARQYTCNHRRQEQENNTIYAFEGSGFIIESSAESAIYEKDNLKDSDESSMVSYTYYKERNYENLLFLMTAFDEGKNLDQYYNAIFDSDLKSFYDFFGFERDDLYSLHKILYSLDSLDYRTTLSEQYSDYADLQEAVGNGHISDIFRLSVRGLINAIDNDSLSLDESTLLYSLCRSFCMCNIEAINDNSYVDEMKEVEDIFVSYLSNKFGMSKEHVTEEVNSVYLQSNSERFFNYMNDGENDTTFNSLINMYPTIGNILWTSDIHYETIRDLNLSNEKVLTLD